MSADSTGGGACGGGGGATILREKAIQLLEDCLHTHSTPNLSVLSNAMPSSVSTTQKCLLTHTSTMSVGQLLLSMGCGTGLQV